MNPINFSIVDEVEVLVGRSLSNVQIRMEIVEDDHGGENNKKDEQNVADKNNNVEGEAAEGEEAEGDEDDEDEELDREEERKKRLLRQTHLIK